jgi:hypothetical protein
MRHYFLIWLLILALYDCKQKPSEQIPQNEGSEHPLLHTKDKVDVSWLKDKNGDIRVPWDVLMRVKLVDTIDEKLGGPVALPIWNDTLKALENKSVILEGFYIPVDETGKSEIVVLSAYPFSQCFFCGKAGIESIVDVLPKEKLSSLKVDTKVKFKGTFKLNQKNYDYLIYILENAELVKD